MSDRKRVRWCLSRIRELDESSTSPGSGAKLVADIANMAKQHMSTDEACSTLFIPDIGSVLGHACIAAVLSIEDSEDMR